jgi:hypothetical protein
MTSHGARASKLFEEKKERRKAKRSQYVPAKHCMNKGYNERFNGYLKDLCLQDVEFKEAQKRIEE